MVKWDLMKVGTPSLKYRYKFCITCIVMYRNTTTSLLRLSSFHQRPLGFSTCYIQFGLCILYTVIYVTWNLYTRNGVWGGGPHRPYSNDITHLIINVAAILSGRSGN